MEYAEGLIDEFKAGNLALPDGFSLRQFLAKMLNCSPKRISKRYEGNNYSKGRKFYVKSSEKMDPMEAKIRRKRLNDLERKYKNKLLHLKMPHLMIANRKVEPEHDEEGKIDQVSAASSSRPQAAGWSTSGMGIVGSARLGLGADAAETAMGSDSLRNHLRMNPTAALRRSLTLNSQPQLMNPIIAAGILDNNTLSRQVEDAGTRALWTQVSSQQRESERLSTLLEAHRRLNSNNGLLGGTPLGRQHSLRATSSLMGDRATSMFTDRASSLPSQSQQLRLQQLLQAERRLRNTGEMTRTLPYVSSLAQPANTTIAMSSNESLITHQLTSMASPGSLHATHASEPLQSLAPLTLQSGAAFRGILGDTRGQKRQASESETDHSTSSSNSRSRRRLTGPADGSGLHFAGPAP